MIKKDTVSNKWKEIWKSDDYKAEIYDNCSTRVYQHAKKINMIKIEVDGTRWVGNTGGFRVYKYFLQNGRAGTLIDLIKKYDEDEASDSAVSDAVSDVVGSRF